MSAAVTKAIIERVRGVETLSDDAAAAQVKLAGILDSTTDGNPAFRYGGKGKSALYPSIVFLEDAGISPIGGVDIGIVTNSLYRMTIWDLSREGFKIPDIADCLELLFDCRRRAPVLPVAAENRCWYGELFQALASPYYDNNYDVFFGIIAFQFVEARP
jgi:hypothetical protein